MELRYAGAARDKEPGANTVAFGLTRAGREGRISLSSSLARQIVDATLGGAAPLSARRFSGGQRGLLAGFLAAALDRIGVDVSLALGSSPPMDVPRAAVEVVGEKIAGRLILEVPPEWFDPTGPSIEAALELASTSLSSDEASALEPGDVVVFDGVKALAPSDARWTAALAVCGHAAPVSIAIDGGLRLEGSFERRGREDTCEVDTSDGAVVAELGRPMLGRWDVFTLGEGATLVSRPRSRSVALRCGDQLVAEGELLAVGGDLAVQVTALRLKPLR